MKTKEHVPGFAVAALVALLLTPRIVSAAPVPAALQACSATVSVDWIGGTIRAQAELDLATAGIRLPSGRAEAEQVLESAIPGLVRGTALAIDLDSYRTVADSIDDGTLQTEALETFLESGRRLDLALSRDLGTLVATYAWKLADLASLYVRHSSPIDMPTADRYLPTRSYTGIIIFVQGIYAVQGEHRTAILSPCLFPRLFDESMTALLERNLQAPGPLRTWGSVAYAAGLDDPVITARAGGDPLRIMATRLFGSLRTDIVISSGDALKILGSPDNRALIQAGRVVFVIDSP
jgi:hypothetical protein